MTATTAAPAKALGTPVRLGGYALLLLVVLAAGFGLGRATGGGEDTPARPAPHAPARHAPAQHPQHSEEQS